MVTRDVEETLRQLVPVAPDLAALAWSFYLSGEGSERELAADLIDILAVATLGTSFADDVVLPPAPPVICDGPYRLGAVLYPRGQVYCSLGLLEEEWVRHLLVVGKTGAGKTNLAFHLLRTLVHHRKPFLVLDWKRNYRDLLQLPQFRDLVVFTVGRDPAPFQFNPLLPPPDVAPGEWLMKLVDVLKHAYFVGEGVEYILRRGFDVVYQRCGLYDDGRRGTPTFAEIRAFVLGLRMHGRMGLWKASALRVLESLCFRHGLGPVLNATSDQELRHLLHVHAVLELDVLADSDKVFLTEALILWLYEYRKTLGHREQFQHALVIEEAHHILSDAKERTAGVETIMETCLRQIREFGQAVIALDQEPSKLSHSIKANTGTQIALNLGAGRDIYDMAMNLGLDAAQRCAIQRLGIGEGIVSTTRRHWQLAHVAFPLVPLRKGLVEDHRVAARYRAWHAGSPEN